MAYAGHFSGLIVYQKAVTVAGEIFRLTKTFPKEEMYSLTDQVRRSSRAIGAQIAEAWGKRQYKKHFVSKMTDADAENYETQHWIGVAMDCGYIDAETGVRVGDLLKELGRVIGSMIAKADSFCGTLE